jgi:hypothetical protein
MERYMTANAKIPFKDVTREGIDQIRAVFAEGVRQSGEFITSASRNDGDEVVDLFHPSERALEIDWERDRDATERHRASICADAFLGVAQMVGLTLVGGFCSIFFANAQPQPGFKEVSFFLAIATVLGLLVGGPLLYNSFRRYISERRVGFIAGFIDRSVKRRANVALGISKNAVYFCLPKDELYGVLLTTRIPFDNIQTCSFHEHEGTEIATLYTKSGKSFPIAMPVGNGLTGAEALAGHIRKLASI